MPRPRLRLAAAVAVPLLLGTACGSVSTAAASLERDAAAADAALAASSGVSVVLRLDDPDGALARALREEPGGLSEELTDIVLGGSVTVRLAATDGRRLAELPEPSLPLPDQLRWWDSAVVVSTARADLLSWRTVDGDLHVSSDLDEVERVATVAGTPLSLADAVAQAPAALREVHDDLRSGAAVRLPVDDLLASTDGLPESPYAGGLPDGLLDELRAAVEPHARLGDLGREGGVRRVSVEVDLERLLTAVDRTLTTGVPGAEPLFGELLETVGDGALAGTLTIEDGHYRRLEVSLASWVDLLDVDDLPDLGDSALVLEVDDAAGPVAVPSRVAPVDVGPVLDGLQRQRQQRDAERRTEWMPRPEDLPALAEDAERITFLQLARNPEELSACAEAG